MAETHVSLTRRKLTTPRSAAVAGILFAMLFGASLILIRLSIPSDLVTGSAWLDTNSRRVALALNLVPYAGIAFLWFIGVIRDRLGSLEDRFFATVFLGSGLLFLAMIFVSAALAGALLSNFVLEGGVPLDSSVYSYIRAAMHHLTNIYAMRMAGVFMISLGTIWLRTGSMHRGWALVTYSFALVLLVTINFSLWVTLIFPGWVLAVSVHILIQNLRNQAQDTTGTVDEA